MARTTRRQLLAGLTGASAALALVSPLRTLAAAPALPLPAGPMRLTRELVRELDDSIRITVRRGWVVGFAHQARGIVVLGTQVSASVDAPPNLAQLAQIEEQRDTQGMFPIMLTETGLVLASSNAAATAQDIAAALRAAEKLIAARADSGTERDHLQRYLAEIHHTGSGQFETLPPDLFFPADTPQRRVETVILPGGLTGEFALSWKARAAPGTGWLMDCERQIVTRIDTLERRSREVWTMAPI
jgi:hypothetical protein